MFNTDIAKDNTVLQIPLTLEDLSKSFLADEGEYRAEITRAFVGKNANGGFICVHYKLLDDGDRPISHYINHSNTYGARLAKQLMESLDLEVVDDVKLLLGKKVIIRVVQKQRYNGEGLINDISSISKDIGYKESTDPDDDIPF
jgi:antitoxin component of MazEF toxin-antitoxin module